MLEIFDVRPKRRSNVRVKGLSLLKLSVKPLLDGIERLTFDLASDNPGGAPRAGRVSFVEQPGHPEEVLFIVNPISPVGDWWSAQHFGGF